ncbi:hypothetical protein [Photobacterium leiognathi]|uniref:hypothetical protein n=1 Tax=Photobacterium leiognathi TaxID=553611 RepID=UPI000D177109|nr:hypothetical protein [Photobacterium leiognathi]PSW66334.1 hypothetical protein C0W88_08115 [Photobacterium leiognathi subsp. mandapamensis]
MYIEKVISYKDAWIEVNEKHPEELSEMLSALTDFISGNIEVESESGRRNPRDAWEKALYDRGWELIDRTHYSADGRRINVGRLGPTKRGLSATFPFGSFDHLSRWLFQQSTLAVKHGLIKIPIMLVPMREFARELESHFMRRETFEMNAGQLEMLAPLSHQHPFLVIGYSNQAPLVSPEVIELESDSYVEIDNSVIDRCIEFPPEYHQAGLDILNYFGTYLREQYPEENAAVKIEQNGLNVRMVIETEDGKSETIEKALHEYELIISGAEPPEKFAKSDKLVLELRNELRIAQFRLESQQDLIGMQNGRIDQLLDIVGSGLSQKNQVAIDFKPEISLSSNITINQDIAAALSNLNELMEELPRSNEAFLALNELEGSLAAIESNNDPESVRKSPAMSKFKRLIDKVTEHGSDLNSAIKSAESGWEIFSELAGKYNKVAEWCGLPLVPSALIK